MGLGQILVTIVAVVTLSIGVYLNQQGTNNFQPKEAGEPEVLSEISESSALPTSSPEPTPVATAQPTALPTNPPSPTIHQDLGDWFYPGASVLTNSPSSSTLISNDDPDKIVDWYKSQFDKLGLNIKTTVRTKTNDNYLAKMAGEKTGLSISIEVKRDANETQATIVVKLNNS